MSNPAVNIKDLLEDAAVGVFAASSGWSIVVGVWSNPGPDTQILVKNMSGREPNPKWKLDYPDIQVLVRGALQGYLASRAKAQQVQNVLLGLPSQDVNDDRMVAVNQIGSIADLGYDEEKRPMHSLNYSLIIEPNPAISDNRLPL